MSEQFSTVTSAAKRHNHDHRTLIAALLKAGEAPDAQLVQPNGETLALWKRQRIDDLAKALLTAAKNAR